MKCPGLGQPRNPEADSPPLASFCGGAGERAGGASPRPAVPGLGRGDTSALQCRLRRRPAEPRSSEHPGLGPCLSRALGKCSLPEAAFGAPFLGVHGWPRVGGVCGCSRPVGRAPRGVVLPPWAALDSWPLVLGFCPLDSPRGPPCLGPVLARRLFSLPFTWDQVCFVVQGACPRTTDPKAWG